MKLPNLSRFAPPGANWDLFARIALWFPLVSAGISLIIFASWLPNAVITAKAGYIIYDSWDDLWVLPRYTFSFFWLSALCLLAMLVSMVAISGCKKNPDPTTTVPTTGTVSTGQKTDYVVTVTSKGGLPLADVAIDIYADDGETGSHHTCTRTVYAQ